MGWNIFLLIWPQALDAMLGDAGVQLLLLPPYSPDLNPIEESFHDLKAFIRANNAYVSLYRADFGQSLHLCMEKLESRASARNHFKNSQIDISEAPESSSHSQLHYRLM
jgi:hypothetical protein